ncbi:hypothetical protein GPK34_00215 [Secundilactobacillus kimchicus]|uniref:hypothetical protein n=1 Tax=Secundilactobacillus kimchicus TaxID=528209 RepID=UPI001C0199A4|nr:hypothetical protein [Secundilactobacillus kimchicus]MBT9670460.1 hypothetical protein [Secundilactobacillus kimchicus]
MKTNELKVWLKERGYRLVFNRHDDKSYFLVKMGYYTLATISATEIGDFNTDYCGFFISENYLKLELIKKLTEFSFTPIDEREGEPEFRVHLLANKYGWLNWEEDTGLLSCNTKSGEPMVGWHSIFTLSKYEKYHKWNPILPPYNSGNPIFKEADKNEVRKGS